MAVEKNCGTCRYGVKPMSFPECVAERCDENYSNWTADPDDKQGAPRPVLGGEDSHFPC
jgi:hypothetical protein